MTFDDNNFEITSAIPRSAAVHMDEFNGEKRSKRAKWWSEKGADELFGYTQKGSMRRSGGRVIVHVDSGFKVGLKGKSGGWEMWDVLSLSL